MVSEQASLVWAQLLLITDLPDISGAIKPLVVGLFVNIKLESMCMKTEVLVIL